jgi:hypothetical protein
VNSAAHKQEYRTAFNASIQEYPTTATWITEKKIRRYHLQFLWSTDSTLYRDINMSIKYTTLMLIVLAHNCCTWYLIHIALGLYLCCCFSHMWRSGGVSTWAPLKHALRTFGRPNCPSSAPHNYMPFFFSMREYQPHLYQLSFIPMSSFSIVDWSLWCQRTTAKTVAAISSYK